MENNITKAICGTSLLSAVILIMILTDPPIIYGLENNNNNSSSSSANISSLSTAAPSSSTSPGPVLLDPNPLLIDKSGNLKNNDVTLAANIKAIRNGTVTDGVSKLLILVQHSSTLAFSIKDRKPDNLTDGTLAPLVSSGGGGGSTALLSRSFSSSSATVDSQRT